jgi:hypothetical protein
MKRVHSLIWVVLASLLATSEARPPNKREAGKAVMTQFHVKSDIQLRYAQTTLETHLKNPTSEASEVVFSMVIPDEAFVSNFTMTLKGTEIVADVKAKKEAADTYTDAVDQGQAAGLVEAESKKEGQLVG